MIVLDTHIWVWWVHGDDQLTRTQVEIIEANETNIIGVSAISCWEVAKLVEYGRLELLCSLQEWVEQALNYPGIRLFELTPEIVIASTQLPGEFHHDPADQIIVATARVHSCPLVTSDSKLLQYPQCDHRIGRSSENPPNEALDAFVLPVEQVVHRSLDVYDRARLVRLPARDIARQYAQPDPKHFTYELG